MNDWFADKYKLKSSRLQNFNYSSNGIYFITICTYSHNNFFGKIINQQMELSKMGLIVKSELLKTISLKKNLNISQWVIMPNHIHLLIEVLDHHVETPCMASLQEHSNQILINYNHRNHPNYYSRLNQKSKQLIPKTIQQFKSAVTRQINPKTIFFAWQSRYHDIIIKDQKQYSTIKQYINNNVINWEKDKYFKN